MDSLRLRLRNTGIPPDLDPGVVGDLQIMLATLLAWRQKDSEQINRLRGEITDLKRELTIHERSTKSVAAATAPLKNRIESQSAEIDQLTKESKSLKKLLQERDGEIGAILKREQSLLHENTLLARKITDLESELKIKRENEQKIQFDVLESIPTVNEVSRLFLATTFMEEKMTEEDFLNCLLEGG